MSNAHRVFGRPGYSVIRSTGSKGAIDLYAIAADVLASVTALQAVAVPIGVWPEVRKHQRKPR